MDKQINNIFENIKTKYGHVASWAIWKPANDDDLTSNMGVDGLFDSKKNPRLFEQLKTNIVMVGYNFSIPVDEFPAFHCFHLPEGMKVHHATLRNASKLRYAFYNTPYWGAYMTDIIKNHVEADSTKVKLTSPDIDSHFQVFRDELATLESKKPLIIAFGGKTYNLLNKNLRQDEYSQLVSITHYAHYGEGCATHEGYRKKILAQLTDNR